MTFQPPNESALLKPAIPEWSAAEAARTLNTWRRILPLDPPEACGADVVLIQQGEKPREVLILASGIVKLTHNLPNGRQCLLELRYPGDFVEHCANGLEALSPVTASTITPCNIYRLEIGRMADAAQRNPEVHAFEKHILKRDLYKAFIANLKLKTLSPIDRLEHALWEIARVRTQDRRTPRTEFVLPLSNSEMADWIGISESHYKQTRSELERAGRLQRMEGKRLVLLRAPYLQGSNGTTLNRTE